MRASSLCLELLLAAAALAPVASAQSVTFDELERLARAGDLVQAHERALAEPDPLQRALFSTWVNYRARDWVQALAAARAGLAVDGANPWLLERSAAAALALRDDAAAGRFAAELALSASVLTESAERDRWLAAARAHALAAGELKRLREQGERAGARARWVSIAVLAACAAALLALVRPTAK